MWWGNNVLITFIMLYLKIITETYCNDSLEFIITCPYIILKFQLPRKPHEGS